MTDVTLNLKLSKNNDGSEKNDVILKACEWNHIDFPLSELGPNNLEEVGTVRFKTLSGACEFYVDNYYFHHNESFVEPELVIGSPDANGVRSVTGFFNWTSMTSFLEDIQDDGYKNTVLYDISTADFSELNLPFNIRMTAANPNALFCVTSSDYRLAFILDKTNVCTISSNKLYPKGDLAFVDGYDILSPTYKLGNLPDGKTISYTRESISGIATTILPFDADVPDGVTAYEFSSVDGSVLKFSEVTEMSAFTPYIIEGSSLEVSSTATKNDVLLTPAEVDVAEIAKFTGTFQAISATTTTADDNKYVLTAGGTSALFKKSHGKIGAFRAFLKYTAASSRQFSVVFDDEATGVRPATTEELETLFNVYSIDGRAVKSKADTLIDMPAGIYVINGKKVVIK